ncbi:MAG: hypothetical protein QM763_04395 [Agriterribacter sp.]
MPGILSYGGLLYDDTGDKVSVLAVPVLSVMVGYVWLLLISSPQKSLPL